MLTRFGLGNNDSEAIVISTSFGRVLQIDNFNTSNVPEVICPIILPALTDVAIDGNGTIYYNTFSTIYKLDETDCSLETIINIGLNEGMNSLSFDTDGNLY